MYGIVIPILLSLSASFAAEKAPPADQAPIKFEAQVLRPKVREERLFGLSWKKRQFKVDRMPVGKGSVPVVRLDGVFSRQRWNLVSGVRWLVTDRGTAPDFSLLVELKGVETPVDISAIGPDNSVETERFLIRFPDFRRLR